MDAGIYKIQSKLFPDKFYIGSSKNLQSRKRFHFNIELMRINRTPFRFHVMKYGIDDLEFIILERCSSNHLISREQYYLSELNPPFNVHRFASSQGNCTDALICAKKDIREEYANHRDSTIKYFREIDLILIEKDVLTMCNRDIIPENIIPI
jgi:group I intron endonuclease